MNWVHHGEGSATDYTSVLTMQPEEFSRIVQTHPQAYMSCILYAMRLLRGMNKCRPMDVSDWMDPLSVIPRERNSLPRMDKKDKARFSRLSAASGSSNSRNSTSSLVTTGTEDSVQLR